jgi:hypothetical protein
VVVRKPASAEFDHLYANLSFRSAAAATVAIGGALSVGGALTQSGGYAYLGSWNVGAPLYPTIGTALAVGWNYNAGTQDISMFNTATGATTAFSFNHLTGASAATLLMRLMANGSLQLGNTGADGGPGDLTVKGAASSNADLTLIEGDTANGWNLGVVVADDSFRISRWAASAFTDRLTITPAGAVAVAGTLDVTGATTLTTATLTGVLTLPTGGVGTPSQRFTGDPDTGPYLFAPDNYRLQAGGTDCAVFAKIGAFGYFSVPGRLSLTPSGSGVATPATVTSKYPLYDAGGTIIGYIPIYATL